MKLDKHTVDRLRLPDGKSDAIFFDEDLAGFGIRLRKAGDRLRGSWVAQYRAGGRTRRMKVGAVEKLKPDEARKAAKKILAKVELGQDPQAEKARDRLRTGHTLRSVAEGFLQVQKEKLRPASYRVTKLYLTGAYFRPLHTTAVAEITLTDVAARIGAIARGNGSVTAGRARSALSAMFKWAMGEGLLGAHPSNPVIGSNKPQDSTPRARVLTDDELAAIWRASGEDSYGSIVKLLTLTACRRDEIGGLRWSELDLDNALLSLPRERVKNKRAHVLSLPPLAFGIIKTVPRRVDRDHLFGGGSPAGYTGWARAKCALDSRLDGRVSEWRLHDLRRTAATRMADLGVQPHIIEAVLNHHGGHRAGVAGVYNRSPYEREVRAALALWADYVKSIAEGGERTIVALRA